MIDPTGAVIQRLSEALGYSTPQAVRTLGAQAARLRATCESHRLECAQLRQIVIDLWTIIDDIDTHGDMAKADDKLFRSLVERRQKDRWKTGIESDGYTLTVLGKKHGAASGGEPMTYNAGGAPKAGPQGTQGGEDE